MPSDEPLSLERPALLISGAAEPPVGEIQSLHARLREGGRPLAVLAPSPAASLGDELRALGVPVFEVSDLPGQRVTARLEDVAVYSGAAYLSKDLGWGLDLVLGLDYPPLVIPAWSGLSPEEMGDVQGLEYRPGQLTLTGGGGASDAVEQRINILRRSPVADDLEAAGLRKRLERLGASAVEIRRAQPVSFERTSDRLRIPSGFRSPYLITDGQSMEARLTGPRVLVSRQPLREWHDMAALLQSLTRDATPLLIIVPQVSDEALAVLVVNKLRGIVTALAVEVSDDSWAEAVADFTRAGPDPQAFDGEARSGQTASVVCDAHKVTLSK